VDVVVHTADAEVCFELLDGSRGASGCVAKDSSLSFRYLTVPGDGDGATYVVGAATAPASTVTLRRVDDTELPVVTGTLDATVVYAGAGDVLSATTVRAIDASSNDVARVALVADPDADIGVGSVGPAVLTWQRRLVGLGADVATDGVYSFAMADYASGLQSYLGLPVTGALDGATRSALLAASKAATGEGEPQPQP
jgi:hypothetical protein